MVFTVKDALSLHHAEVDCGVPPPVPHSVRLWDNVSTVGSQVVYQCDAGYRSVGEGNVSVCTASGRWDAAPLHCQGDNDTRDTFSYLQNKSRLLKMSQGSTELPTITCCLLVVEINCQAPFYKAHAEMVWDGTSHIGSVVYYRCEEGYRTRSGANSSTCGENGLWEEVDLRCEGADVIFI